MNNSCYILIFALFFACTASGQEIAVLKYNGGGDWYANPTALPNLIRFCNENSKTAINETPETVEAGSIDIFQYPFLHMTGHGNVYFSAEEAENLKKYLLAGGFLHIDDNYGMEPYIKRELTKLFPDKELTEIPLKHSIFHKPYKFPDGLPKIHEHDGKRPQAFGIFHGNRLMVLFTYESDLGDGWENPEVHNDPEEVRLRALRMGANIITCAFQQEIK